MLTIETSPAQMTPDLIRAELSRVLNSTAFSQAPRLRSFLRFVVEFSLQEETGPLKEAIIGAAVYEKHPAYDTKDEPIVRIEARRLRAKLHHYYENEGANDPVRIDIPKGGYLPKFVQRTELAVVSGEEGFQQEDVPFAESAVEPPFLEQRSVLADAFPPHGSAAGHEHAHMAGSVEVTSAATALPATRATHANPGAWIFGSAALAIALAVSVWAIHHRGFQVGTPHGGVVHVDPLTSSPGNVIQGALSSDGKELAYAWNGTDGGTNFDIYIKQTEIGSPLRLTSDPAQDLHPAWSPDARYVAFLRISPDATEIVTIPALGGSERVVAEIQPSSPWKADGAQIETNPGPAWSPDGSFLVAADSSSQDAGVGLFAFSLLDGKKKRLTTAPALARDGYPRFSPDGTQLAFVRQLSHSVRDIYILTLHDGSVRRITSEGADVQGVAWSHDQGSLYFSSNRGGSYQLWKIALSGAALESVQASGDEVTDPFVAPNGSSLLYTAATENSNLWRIPLRAASSGQKPRPAAGSGVTELIASTRHNNSPQYSLDGRSIAFISDRSGTWELWVAKSDGSDPQLLTHFGGPMIGTPHWSPDSRYLVFDARPNGKSDIFIVPTSGGEPQPFTHNAAQNQMPYWSHDGSWIYFSSSAGGSMQLWKKPLAGGEAVRLSSVACRDSVESVDGRTIYFQTTGHGIWQISSDGKNEALIPELVDIFPNRYMAITARGLYFVDSETAPRRIRMFRFSDRHLETLGSIARNLVDGTPSLSISPDEQWAVFAQQDQSSSNILRLRNLP